MMDPDAGAGQVKRRPVPSSAEDPLWYKDAIIYELHVRAFADGNGDGIGDFVGLAGKLDYLRDLGVTAIWLLPFYPSPLRDDGYDIADYTGVHPDCGTLQDFRHFLRAAHSRGLQVITELVLNHTSDQHPWFQRARRAPPGSVHRDFYVWSDTNERFRDARVIFRDFEGSNWSWDPVARAYYWHRFSAQQPDLNYDSPQVHRAIRRVVDFWLEMGVDGMRLDAAPYLYEREGTSCENLPESHEALRRLRRYIDQRYANRILLAEANQWPEDAAAYFGDGDECHMAFHFPLMPRMFMALRMEDRYPIVEILDQTPAIPAGCQWAVFLRNHDELTLEMVTDEERDYMVRVYAADPRARLNLGIRRRLAPLLGSDRRRIELMNGLLLSLPGSPVIYYGDEIGMGDNIYLGDRNGVRTPMQWSADRNAGFSRANSQGLYLPVIIDPDFHYETVNVEARENNPHSILWWTRRLIALRRRFKAFSRGRLEFLMPENRRVLAFMRRHEEETILIVANLSRFAQYVELDLAPLQGMTPVELFGRTRFPPIGPGTYLLTLGPHAFYWFSLEKGEPGGSKGGPSDGQAGSAASPSSAAPVPPLLRVRPSWAEILGSAGRDALGEALALYLPGRRWFTGKARIVKSVTAQDAIPIARDPESSHMLLMRVEYAEGESEVYVVIAALLSGPRAERMLADRPGEVIARIGSDATVLVDGFTEEPPARALLRIIMRQKGLDGLGGQVKGRKVREVRWPFDREIPAAVPLRGKRSDSSVQFGEQLLLKLVRRIEPGIHPELEMGMHLTARSFPHAPPTAGWIEYRNGRESVTVAVLHRFVPNVGSAWRFTLDHLGALLESVAASPAEAAGLVPPMVRAVDLAARETPPAVVKWIGPYLGSAELLGKRTAELHVALAAAGDDPAFAPEPYTPFYQRALFQSMRNLVREVFGQMRRHPGRIPEEAAAGARAVLDREHDVLERMRGIVGMRMTGLRTRVHGDLHLGQVLVTGRDFVIVDFEGDPALSLSARRIKRSPLRDVAGMLRSFDAAAHAALLEQKHAGPAVEDRLAVLRAASAAWARWTGAAYLRGYLEGAGGAGFLPRDREETSAVLNVFLLEKSVHALGFELSNRPDWVALPLRGILLSLDGDPAVLE